MMAGPNSEGYVFLFSCAYHRRKFRSQTSDNMDRWKSRGGKSPRREEKIREEKKKEEERRRKKIREKKKSEERRCRCAKFVAPEGQK